jgi:DNA polymerase IV (DinB-like DNA polymerase)
MTLLRAFADKFEQVSIDEAFLDVSEKISSYDSARLLALQIKQEVERMEGLTCSIGVAPNKSSAKIASEFQKPDGLTVIPPENLKDFLSPLPA